MSFIYLAAPYSHPDADIRESRAQQINAACAELLAQGPDIYSPITHGHALVPHLPPALQQDHDFWLSHCLELLSEASELYVLCLPGWHISTGVQAEVQFARELSIPIFYLAPDTLTILPEIPQ